MHKFDQLVKEVTPHTLEGRYTRTDGSAFDYNYKGLRVSPDRFIAARVDTRADDDADWGGRIELRIYDANGRTTDIANVTIYGPALKFSFLDGKRDAVEPAEVSSSSGRGDADDTRLYTRVLGLAADLAEAWTERERPRLERESAKRLAERAARREEIRREREETTRQAGVLRERLADADAVRVYVAHRTTPIVFKDGVELSDSLTVKGSNDWGDHTLSSPQRIDVKHAGQGRYQTEFEVER